MMDLLSRNTIDKNPALHARNYAVWRTRRGRRFLVERAECLPAASYQMQLRGVNGAYT